LPTWGETIRRLREEAGNERPQYKPTIIENTDQPKAIYNDKGGVKGEHGYQNATKI
jgi:hypothetical protein